MIREDRDKRSDFTEHQRRFYPKYSPVKAHLDTKKSRITCGSVHSLKLIIDYPGITAQITRTATFFSTAKDAAIMHRKVVHGQLHFKEAQFQRSAGTGPIYKLAVAVPVAGAAAGAAITATSPVEQALEGNDEILVAELGHWHFPYSCRVHRFAPERVE